MYSFRRVSIDEFERHPIRQAIAEETIFQTPAWLRFLKATQGGEPVISIVESESEILGYFTGMLFSKFGVHILGSPFPGWSTGYMGFRLAKDASHANVLKAFIPWAFTNLRCSHIEMMDRNIEEEQVKGLGMHFRREAGFQIDLTKDTEELFQRMSHQCRTNVRKAIRSGLVIEAASDPAFSDDYYVQLLDVFGKRRLVPTFPRNRVSELISRFRNNPQCLFLRARNKDGKCIASAIMLGGGKMAYLWGAASLREYQNLRPNELVYWTVIKSAKELGLKYLDMGGAGDYKSKYGGTPIAIPWFQTSSYWFLPKLRNAAEVMFGLQQRVFGRLVHHEQVPG